MDKKHEKGVLEKKDKIMFIMFIVAVIVLVSILFGNAGSSRKERRPDGEKTDQTDAFESVEKKKNSKAKKEITPEVKQLMAKAGRADPFVISDQGYAGSGVAGTEMRLKGITLDSEGNPLAVIGDEIVGVGDVIGEAKILDILKDSVLVDVGGKEYILVLWEKRDPEGEV